MPREKPSRASITFVQGPQGPAGPVSPDAVLTTGSYADPAWITSLAGAKITGSVPLAVLAAAATVLATPRSINGVAFDGSANITVPAAAGTLTGATLAAGVLASSLTSVGVLGALTVTAPIVGSVTGSSGFTTGNAATATALAVARLINGVAFDGSADITISAAAAAGTLTGATLAANVLASSLTSVGVLAGLTVTAPIVGSVTGSSASTTGNAATATALQTARAINGVNFDGTAAITVAAAAGTLTGATLASGVTASSLTSAGSSFTVGGALALGVVAADGLVLQNTTAATAGVPVQQSPDLRIRSNVWNTTATAATNTNDWILRSVPVSGATPSGLLKFGSSLNGGAYTFPLTVSNIGEVTVPNGGGFYAASGASNCLVGIGGSVAVRLSLTNFQLLAGHDFFWSGRALMRSPADSQLNILNNATTIGFGIDCSTDAVCKLRTRAQSAYATLDCLGLKASGVAGVSFGPAAVASITIVNGIVTACS